jgi:hypothetical protein
MTYRIDARVERAEPPRSYPPADCPGLKAEPKQLTPRDHPVLAIRQLPDRPLLCASLSQCPYIGLSDGLVGMPRRVPGRGARMARGLCQFMRGSAP